MTSIFPFLSSNWKFSFVLPSLYFPVLNVKSPTFSNLPPFTMTPFSLAIMISDFLPSTSNPPANFVAPWLFNPTSLIIKLADFPFRFLFPANVFPFNNLLADSESLLLLFNNTFSSCSMLNWSYSLWEIPLLFTSAIWTKVDLSCPSTFSNCVLLGSFTSMWFNLFRTSVFGFSASTASFKVSEGIVLGAATKVGTDWVNILLPTPDSAPLTVGRSPSDCAVVGTVTAFDIKSVCVEVATGFIFSSL